MRAKVAEFSASASIPVSKVGKPEVSVALRVGHVRGNQDTDAQPFIQLANQNETTVRGDPWFLETDLEGGNDSPISTFLRIVVIVLQLASEAVKNLSGSYRCRELSKN
jgi:hypothetical protein